MTAFIDDHRDEYGVEPICRVLPIAPSPALARVGNFAAFLEQPFDDAISYAALRKAETVGRPIGSPEWLDDMEARTGLQLKPRKRGPKPKAV
ncbi:hypothetical protein NX02_17380 [Sphingomonas sanxanigenens DSM 19645 = NX02]|uniref:Uncharacterized protein n=1 Tax=Sphingomonas sanxanigenens DSM 19645 = NX02 TaxID=1123269 RepID=W0AFU5_9SPHN|nr:hypothetical protein NX02_17380 [Sphingomonas sanxanigenens DSM 19645 = NX02]